jgi:hypothetical protein
MSDCGHFAASLPAANTVSPRPKAHAFCFSLVTGETVLCMFQADVKLRNGFVMVFHMEMQRQLSPVEPHRPLRLDPVAPELWLEQLSWASRSGRKDVKSNWKVLAWDFPVCGPGFLTRQATRAEELGVTPRQQSNTTTSTPQH